MDSAFHEVAKPLFADPELAAQFCMSRAQIAINSFRAVLECPALMFKTVPCAVVVECVEMIAAVDVHKKVEGQSDRESWTKFYMDVFERCNDQEHLLTFLRTGWHLNPPAVAAR